VCCVRLMCHLLVFFFWVLCFFKGEELLKPGGGGKKIRGRGGPPPPRPPPSPAGTNPAPHWEGRGGGGGGEMIAFPATHHTAADLPGVPRPSTLRPLQRPPGRRAAVIGLVTSTRLRVEGGNLLGSKAIGRGGPFGITALAAVSDRRRASSTGLERPRVTLAVGTPARPTDAVVESSHRLHGRGAWEASIAGQVQGASI